MNKLFFSTIFLIIIAIIINLFIDNKKLKESISDLTARITLPTCENK